MFASAQTERVFQFIFNKIAADRRILLGSYEYGQEFCERARF